MLVINGAGLSDQTNFARESFGDGNAGESRASPGFLKDRFTHTGRGTSALGYIEHSNPLRHFILLLLSLLADAAPDKVWCVGRIRTRAFLDSHHHLHYH